MNKEWIRIDPEDALFRVRELFRIALTPFKDGPHGHDKNQADPDGSYRSEINCGEVREAILLLDLLTDMDGRADWEEKA
jgi:hypothetical protein